MAASPAIPQTLTLPDGRKLDYLVSGPADGFPLVYLHGTPGGAYPPGAAVLGPCEERNIKLITISRAGYGGSTRVKGRRIVHVVPDVQAVLGHLGIDKCVVGGESGDGKQFISQTGWEDMSCFRGATGGDEETEKKKTERWK